jgi:hypothetical protein
MTNKTMDAFDILSGRLSSRHLRKALSGGFCFRSIDDERLANQKIISQRPKLARETISLVHSSRTSLQANIQYLHERILAAMAMREALPIVRFADGEYAFYSLSLACNGLYKQARSRQEIQAVLANHIHALKYVQTNGFMAPLIFPANLQFRPSLKKILGIKEKPGSSLSFIRLLSSYGIHLASDSYIPFYAIYAYLTSNKFLSACNGRSICILNSDINMEAANEWFNKGGSRVRISSVCMPSEYVATSWKQYKNDILSQIPRETDICLVGAGIGSLEVCADISQSFSIPAIDAGHVLNMISSRVDKSAGARLFTEWKQNA